MTRVLAQLAGVVFLVSAVLFNPLTTRLAAGFVRDHLGRPTFEGPGVGDVLRAQAAYLAATALCFGAAWLVARLPRLDRLTRRGIAAKLALSLFVLAVPFFTLEVALRTVSQYPKKETSLFVRDDALGWRLRPSTTQPWGGVTVTTNRRGLRGPSVAYEKPARVKRIVWLGDSVTFGYRVADWRDTFPYRVAERLRGAGVEVESINAGVGGYSPWQEALWLREEGVRYDPDLVVLSFVLNDVTEKFHLARFGGSGESRQLRESFHSWTEQLLGRSALVHRVRHSVRMFNARRRLGDDLRLGAIRREALDVRSLVEHPERENVRAAWEITLESVGRIAETCREHDVPLLIAVFPFAMQLEAPDAMSAPQRTLEEWSRARGIPIVDLLPALSDAPKGNGAAPDRYFLDTNHLTVEGHRVVAETLSEAVREELLDGDEA